MTDLPRFTGSLRAFSGINSSNDPCEQQRLREELQWKKKQKSKPTTLSWLEIQNQIREGKNKQKGIDVTRELEKVALKFIGEDASQDGVQESAAILFETFYDTEKVTSVESSKLKKMFGTYPGSLATKAFELVKQLTEYMPKKTTEESNKDVLGKSYFGKNVKLDLDIIDLDFDRLFSEYSEENESAVQVDSFIQQFKDKLDIDQKNNVESAGAVQQEITNKTSGQFSSSWLHTNCEQYLKDNPSSLNSNDLASAVFEILSSTKSSDEIQNELFDLMGFEAFDLIQKILEHRQQIVNAACEQQTNGFIESDYQYLDPTRKHVKSAPGAQVTVQSEREKQMLKKMQKEERKLMRRDPELYNEIFNQNREQLDAIQTQPLLRRATTNATQQYPYVFDEFAARKHASSFIGGTKVLLPESATKEVLRKYEEVNIPATAIKPPSHLNMAVDISALDDVAQLVFSGIKKLNKIQSIVFDSAYNTNENLLVSAPTGAGKTNIALLTIVHEINNHIKNNVVRKEEFKIVYVAPMKALAAEMTSNFGKKLAPLGVVVRELTGDMQLTKKEIQETQMLVTTPEKWDVVTRKGSSDVALSQLVKLLIIDEVHLLHDDRGAVLEALVARTLRQVESTQNMIRIVGLSATLPNYLDVARFLNVNPHKGLFYFDGRFRPVPLQQTFIGIRATGFLQQQKDMDEICYEKVLDNVKQGHQVMVFVHARNATVKTAMTMREMSKLEGDNELFEPDKNASYGAMEKKVMRSRNKQLREMFPDGFGIHHAGMLRQDRTLVESLFSQGFIKVLVCTATLAWGVNLPAHAVIIKGTQIYDAKKGSFVDIGILDVMQIFGRAGRPQFDKWGHGMIITKHDKLSHYLHLLTQQTPIESQLVNRLMDILNAEISLGTVTNIDEGVKWLSYTYLYVRMRINPIVYGINYKEKDEDPLLEKHRFELIRDCSRKLDKARMIRFDERTSYVYPTNLGRTASNFYIDFATIEVVNEFFKPFINEAEILSIVSKAHEFEQVKVRADEIPELEQQMQDSCETVIKGGAENSYGKVNILLQAYVSKAQLDSFSLISDMSYVAQNAARIVRALFEVSLQKNWPLMAKRMLTLSKVVDRRMWQSEHPLKQCEGLTFEILNKLEKLNMTIDRLRDMDSKEIGYMLNHPKIGTKVRSYAFQFPQVALASSIQPITRNVLRVHLHVIPDFQWNDKMHGGVAEPWWIWVEDPETNTIYHSEYFLLTRKAVKAKETQVMVFTIPIFDPLPPQYYVRVVSDRWLHAEAVCAISFKHLILPDHHPPHTELLNLQPISVSALRNPTLENLYNFSHFNPIQTQLFHTLYYSDSNVLLGAPTGSGKTIAAEIAIFRVFREYPGTKAVYIAPLKALVRERVADWKIRLERKLGKKVVELTGDVTPDMRAIVNADVIVTTPEKWDGVSRSWQTRKYVKDVSLLVIDEIHLLGDDRGPVLEVIVSRTNFISSHTTKTCRVIGLSTALANAKDLADWLGIGQDGLFNFRPSVRPVPLEVHIAGFPGKHYCPRMATMNKPCFKGIQTHSPTKPVLIFVSSRRQTRLTALDLVAYLAGDSNPKQWLHLDETEMESLITSVRDQNLKLTLSFGIGLHHAGLHERDRKIAEELFVNQKIQVLIATSTLAWGVNFPAHLVIVKGTEYYDGKTKRYVDFPITDVLQMMGRAGRPQYDDNGVALILVQDSKKHFYKKFLYEPFPVESNLVEVLPDHLNAEIVAGTITSKQDAMDYMTWTYFFRRLLMNPTYYNLDDTDHHSMNTFLSNLIEGAIYELQSSYCVDVYEDGNTLEPSVLGRISSYYYLNHLTLRMFKTRLTSEMTMEELLKVLSDAQEYDQLPVRHNEDQMNADLAEKLPLQVDRYTYDSPHTKTHLLLQAHFSRVPLPIADYGTDTKSVFDQAIRIMQAMIDICADQGWLASVLQIINLIQMVIQGRWYYDSSLLILPHVKNENLKYFKIQSKMRSTPSSLISSIPELLQVYRSNKKSLHAMLNKAMNKKEIDEISNVLSKLPIVDLAVHIHGAWLEEAGKVRQQTRLIDLTEYRRTEQVWLKVHADQEYSLKIKLNRSQISEKRFDQKGYAPLFSKPKDEGWFFVVGEVDNNDLVALKRVGAIHRRDTTVTLAFFTPETVGRKIYTLYVMSDIYHGLDQQYDLYFDVIQPLNDEEG